VKDYYEKKEEQARRNRKGHLTNNYGKASFYELKELIIV
jgi:hypothetical protein